MQVLESRELERLVRETFPEKRGFLVENELGSRYRPTVAFVHGGSDPFLDEQFEEWLAGSASFVVLYQLLNRLCRAGALAPGNYAVKHWSS